LITGAALFALASVNLAAAAWQHPALASRLTTASLPIVVVGAAAALVSVAALARRRYSIARAASAVTAVALVWGWFIAESPRLIGTQLTIHSAAATRPALTAVSVAALTVYDMCKAVDRGMRIEGVRLARKSGGRSGHFRAKE